MSRRGRICMYVPHLYPVVSGGKVPFAGGIEVQLALLARGLVRRGFEVFVATCDYGQPDDLVVDGIRLVRCWRPEAGPPVVRFFHPRLTLTIAGLRRADADVYLCRGAGLNAGVTFDVAHAMRRSFVLMLGHDHDARADLPDVHGPRDRIWYRRAVRGADVIVTQTEGQRAVLFASFGRDSVVLMNPVEIPERAVDAGANAEAVWLATYKDSKRPEWFTRLAARNPGVRCVMAGVIPPPPLTDASFRAAQAAAAGRANLEVLPTIPHERIGGFFGGAGLFTHTSPAEGFPNAFLEAWSYGLPTVTCFDPDGIIARERLGECHDTFEAWEAAVLRWLADPALRREAGARARTYAARSHDTGVVHDRMAEIVDRLVSKRRARR